MSHKAKSVNLNDFNNSININNIINQQDNIKFLKENLNENEIDDSKLIEDINNFFASTDLYGNIFTNSNPNYIDILIKSMNLISKEVIPLNYYKITISDASNKKEFLHLAKKNNIYISFTKFIILLDIKNSKIIEAYISTQNFQKSIKKNFIHKKDENVLMTEFYAGELENENFSLESNTKKIENLKNEIINDLNGNDVQLKI